MSFSLLIDLSGAVVIPPPPIGAYVGLAVGYLRRNEGPLDATYNRAWDADVFASLADIPAKHGDVALVAATSLWYQWVDTNAWLPMNVVTPTDTSFTTSLLLMGG